MAILAGPAEVTAFVTFAAVMAGTPGPGNTLLTTVGATVGVRRGLGSLLGQVIGMGAMLFGITLGLGSLLLAHPLALEILRWTGAALLCWMAWRIGTAKPAEQAAGAPAGFLRMAAFQWVNPKAWLAGTAAVATFMDRHASGGAHGPAAGQAVILAGLFTLTALPCCFPWLAFGAVLQRYTRTPRTRRVLNVVMAALLAASVILVTWSRRG